MIKFLMHVPGEIGPWKLGGYLRDPLILIDHKSFSSKGKFVFFFDKFLQLGEVFCCIFATDPSARNVNDESWVFFF